MAEDLRQGDRVAWHNRPQFTPEPHDVKRANRERTGSDQPEAAVEGESASATDRR